MPPQAALVRTLYRASLRAAARLHAAGARATSALDDTDLGFDGTSPLDALSPRGMRDRIRAAFRANSHVPDTAAQYLIDAALAGLQEANIRAHAMETSQHRGRPSTVRHRVGSVIQVERHGVRSRAVIVGYDMSCAASPAWMARMGVAALPHGAGQPFYHVLTHAYDALPTTHVEYVPQDSVQDLELSPADAAGRFVLHPLLHHYFTQFNTETGAYTPTHALACLYPDAAGEWSAEAAIDAAARGVRVQLSRVHVIADEHARDDAAAHSAPHVRTPADAGALI